MLIAVGLSWGLLSRALGGGVPLGVLIAMVLAFGGAISSVYPLCVAQTYDCLERRYYVAASSRLLMVCSTGATINPLLTSFLRLIYGPA